MKVVCRDRGGRSGYASATARAVAGIDPALVARRAAAKVHDAPLAELEPGSHPVVLEPEAVAVLLELLGSLALNELTHVKGRGALSDRLGEQVAAPSSTTGARPRSPAGTPARRATRPTPAARRTAPPP